MRFTAGQLCSLIFSDVGCYIAAMRIGLRFEFLVHGINNHFAARQEGDRSSVLITQDKLMVNIGARMYTRSMLHSCEP